MGEKETKKLFEKYLGRGFDYKKYTDNVEPIIDKKCSCLKIVLLSKDIKELFDLLSKCVDVLSSNGFEYHVQQNQVIGILNSNNNGERLQVLLDDLALKLPGKISIKSLVTTVYYFTIIGNDSSFVSVYIPELLEVQ